MKEIDDMLDKWVYNTIIRKQLRDLIIKKLKIKNENSSRSTF
jgi:hypothetical protein